MSRKIDERLPQESGQGVLPQYTAVKTPWERLIGYRDAMHYVSRYRSVISAAIMQGLRIMIPDYEERAKVLCEEAYGRLWAYQSSEGVPESLHKKLNVHPFCRGNFVGGLLGDEGDDGLLMCGRVNDFGTYRVEKELDICDWDIVGSELCRATTMSLQAGADAMATKLRSGAKLEYCMVEAKGCGDRHCRIVAECREKYPMPEHEIWESFGPVATADQIKDTLDEDMVKESCVFREECDYRFINGTNLEEESPMASTPTVTCAATFYVLPAIEYAIQKGYVEDKQARHILKCVCEAAGKAAFGEHYTKDALRNWLAVPREIGDDDGRVLGGHIETFLQCMTVPYTIEAFNKEEVVYLIDRNQLACGYPKFVDCLVAYWFGASKTLINTKWAAWEEAKDTPEDKLRLKIAKKIDKRC